jgi:hypothetical protein
VVYYEKYKNATGPTASNGANVKSRCRARRGRGVGYGFVFRADGSPIPSTFTVTPVKRRRLHFHDSRLTVVDPGTARGSTSSAAEGQMNAAPTQQTAEDYTEDERLGGRQVRRLRLQPAFRKTVHHDAEHLADFRRWRRSRSSRRPLPT